VIGNTESDCFAAAGDNIRNYTGFSGRIIVNAPGKNLSARRCAANGTGFNNFFYLSTVSQ